MYRSIEHRARGAVAIGLVEVTSGALVGLTGLTLGMPWVGLAAAVGAMAALLAWRRADGDRGDYLRAAVRRWRHATTPYVVDEARAMPPIARRGGDGR